MRTELLMIWKNHQKFLLVAAMRRVLNGGKRLVSLSPLNSYFTHSFNLLILIMIVTSMKKQMGLIYGCPSEDVVTGLKIQCMGWKSVYHNPERKAFLGVSPATLEVALIQHKRWSEGLSQIFFSKYCPFIYGHGKIKLGAQMGYCTYLLWAPLSLPTLCYVIVPSLCLLNGVSLFPAVCVYPNLSFFF